MLSLSQIANQSDTSSPDHPRQSQRSISLAHLWLLFLYTCLKSSKLSLSTISIDQYNSYENEAQGNKPVLPLQTLENIVLPLSQKSYGIIPLSHSPKMLLCSAH